MLSVTLLSFLFFTALVGVITWYITRNDDVSTNDKTNLGCLSFCYKRLRHEPILSALRL